MALGVSQDWRKGSRREMDFSKALDKNISKGILGLDDYRINTDDC